MEYLIFINMLLNFSITLLSLIACFYLIYHYFKDRKKNYSTHALIRMLYVLTFFIFIDNLYHSFLTLSQYNIINEKYFYFLSSLNLQILPKIGIFISSVFLIHFIMEKRIEEFKSKEDSLNELKILNQELEKKVIQSEKAQESLEKKMHEVEKYNEIAKEREQKMIELMKKIDILENKIKK
ncbi:MAG: hypothetical protein QXM96_00325 [Candidatus Woesearchaeota archaeon]